MTNAMIFADAKKYLFEIRHYIIAAALIYFISIYFGYLLAAASPDIARNMIEQFRQMVGPIEKASAFSLFVYIFMKNAVAAFLASFLGVVIGILPMVSLLGNGAFLGVFAYFFFGQASSAIIFFAGILPHGVIEVPTFIFSAATGFWLGVAVIRRVAFGEKRVIEKTLMASRFYFLTILPLLFMAALIEAFITPIILSAARSIFM